MFLTNKVEKKVVSVDCPHDWYRMSLDTSQHSDGVRYSSAH